MALLIRFQKRPDAAADHRPLSAFIIGLEATIEVNNQRASAQIHASFAGTFYRADPAWSRDGPLSRIFAGLAEQRIDAVASPQLVVARLAIQVVIAVAALWRRR